MVAGGGVLGRGVSVGAGELEVARDDRVVLAVVAQCLRDPTVQ